MTADGTSYSCFEYCNASQPSACPAGQPCQSLGYGDPNVGMCMPCTTVQCGAQCCNPGEICDQATLTCQATPTCDPIAQNCGAGQACYVNWNDSQFECAAAGHAPAKTLCDPNSGAKTCAQGYDCFMDQTGIYYRCERYCDYTPATCASPSSCTDLGLGSYGYCAPSPERDCNVLQQNCHDSTQGCYPGTNGSAVCLKAGTSGEGAACSAVTDCAKGLVCSSDTWGNDYCAKICNTTGGNPRCTNLTDMCQDQGTGYGICQTCPQEAICGTGASTICCSNGWICDAASGTCVAPVICNPVKQDCIDPSQACYFDYNISGYECKKAGLGATGTSCSDDTQCVRGDGCLGPNWNSCAPYCDVSAPVGACPAGMTCQDLGDGNGGCM